mmetsp:Transcript_21175/g.46692  ORF Transcript_21175/g.46692 Transcript_21175/m.46692 type:complete len:95 (+) Transcript_21175:85-369(+)
MNRCLKMGDASKWQFQMKHTQERNSKSSDKPEILAFEASPSLMRRFGIHARFMASCCGVWGLWTTTACATGILCGCITCCGMPIIIGCVDGIHC